LVIIYELGEIEPGSKSRGQIFLHAISMKGMYEGIMKGSRGYITVQRGHIK